jgi:tetratricopeptide (TPR) repeat protein
MTPFFRNFLLYSVFGLALVTTGCDQRDAATSEPSDTSASVPTIFLSPSVAGNYLAGRFAVDNDDLGVATQFFELAIASSKEKEFLVERALPSAIGSGNFDKAVALARDVDVKKPLATSQLALTVLLVDAFDRNDMDAVKLLLPDLRNDGFGKLLRPLMDVWVEAIQKNDKKALTDLQTLARSFPSLAPLTYMHAAFINDIAGNVDQAESFYTKALNAQASVRTAWLSAQFLERQGQKAKALAVYEDLADMMPGSPFAQLVIRRMNSATVQSDAPVKTPRHGVAAALYDIATVLHQEGSYRLALLYAQLAHVLAPQDPFVNMLLGDIFAGSRIPHLAEGYYRAIEKQSDFYILAQMRLAQAFEGTDKLDQAIEILEEMAKDDLVRRQAMTEIGDIYRRREDFSKAIPYYTRAIDVITTPVDRDWALYYARGISFERTKQWDKAEADLQIALELNPDQPEVLNYLAYSWADSGKNLPRALDMLQEALAGAPDDPYITDSVGWALYKMGRFHDAVPYLEAAVQALPADPTINDHLGDIYWRVGRRIEARFQWERALKHVTKTDTDLKNAIKEKIKSGLPDLLMPVEPVKKQDKKEEKGP